MFAQKPYRNGCRNRPTVRNFMLVLIDNSTAAIMAATGDFLLLVPQAVILVMQLIASVTCFGTVLNYEKGQLDLYK